MKKLVLSLIIVFFVVFNLNANDNTKKYENFPSIKLRHGYGYTFSQNFITENTRVGLNRITCKLTETGNYNGEKEPNCDWTNKFRNLKFKIDINSSIKVAEYKSPYHITFHPIKRKKDNLNIQYTIKYYFLVSNKVLGPNYLITNQPYEITWCGDGIIDQYKDKYSNNYIKEICDPKDLKKLNWGSIGCSSKCTPINRSVAK